MRKSVRGIVAVLVLVPALALAQGAGVCNFSGSATLPSNFGNTPQVQANFSFGGTLSHVAANSCAFPGGVQTTTGKLTGNCAGNVHNGTANIPGGTSVTFAGVCAGADCDGIAVAPKPAGFLYILVFDQATIENALEKCPTDTFSSASFDGAAVGGTN